MHKESLRVSFFGLLLRSKGLLISSFSFFNLNEGKFKQILALSEKLVFRPHNF